MGNQVTLGGGDEPRVRLLLAIGNGAAGEELRHALRTQRDLEIVADAGDPNEAARLAAVLHPDVVLLDGSGGGTLEPIRLLRGYRPRPALVILSTINCDGYAGTLARLGLNVLSSDAPPGDVIGALAAAYVAKTGGTPPQPFARANGDDRNTSAKQVTVRELAVLRLVETGCRDWDIAHQLGITVRTVEEHLRHVRDKLGASSRTEAVYLARKRGWIP